MNNLEKYAFAKLAFSPADIKFEVGPSSIDGKGLFTNSDFESGERLLPVFWHKKGKAFDQRRKQGIPIHWPTDVTWSDQAWNINHQKSSNCSVKKEGDTWYCISKKFLPKGTEITVNYEKLPAFVNTDVKGFIEK
jgi:hypothetical protein